LEGPKVNCSSGQRWRTFPCQFKILKSFFSSRKGRKGGADIKAQCGSKTESITKIGGGSNFPTRGKGTGLFRSLIMRGKGGGGLGGKYLQKKAR